MQPETNEPRPGRAAPEDVGRACPYCRFPLKEGVETVRCGVCQAAHHADCWQDNGGCAVIACAGGPTEGPAQTAQPTQVFAAPAPGQQQPAQPWAGYNPYPPPPPSPPQPPPIGPRRGPSLAIAVIVLAVAVGGAAVAIALTSSGKSTHLVAVSTPTTVTTSGPSTSEPTSSGSSTSEETPAPETEATEKDGQLPSSDDTKMGEEIRDFLREWHQDVVASDFRGAWNLLTARKRQQSLDRYGYPGWVKNQSTLTPYLDPSGIEVSVLEANRDNGVATVDVTGMKWDKPGSSCSEWSGITWVKYEGEHWRYDPGYSTSPERERHWKSRYPELLGGRC